MSIKNEVFNLLDKWDGCILIVRDDPTEVAAYLCDELDISFERARELVSKWLDTHRAN